MSTTVFEGKNIQGTILKLGIPAIIGQLVTLIYNLVDTYFVSLTNSPAQISYMRRS
jgi:Na+-driven multidrug efflux pump